MSIADNDDVKVPKSRSPKFPYISLDLAIERVKKIHSQVRDHAQPRDVLARAYGKPAKSSATIQTFATLTQYGLLEPITMNGERRLKVTALARKIIHPNAPQDDVNNALRIAALSPPIFQELWNRFGEMDGLGDDVPLYYLTHDRQNEHSTVFTETAAPDALRVYRATLDYVGLKKPDIPAEDAVSSDGESEVVGNGRPEQFEAAPQRKKAPPPERRGQSETQNGERVVFIEEGQPMQYLKLIACGDLDEYLLEALEDYVKRQRRRLTMAAEDDL